MTSKHQLFTTGYAGHSVETFVEKLRRHGVDVVVDVRQNPVSRKKGFSRVALSSYLNSQDFEYLHCRELGVPAHLRKQLRQGRQNLDEYLRAFGEYLGDLGSTLDALYQLAARKRCCLICVEERHEDCHRSIVAQAVAARNGHAVEIVHI